ncbi:hypothetical protein BSKO_01041 [Bryopsis sp. KO-2023]|nr:hypothetical protein BSKO_01041 [Bryopsis sp. KO-2023]
MSRMGPELEISFLQCFKHVSALLERQMRKVKLKYRTNVLHILSYVLRTSFMKFKSENKYAKRLSNRMTAIFEFLKECGDDQKPTISRVLLAWRRENLFCKPLMEDMYEVLGWQPEEPVQSPVAYTINCSFDSQARVVENIPKEPKPEGEDVQTGRHGGAGVLQDGAPRGRAHSNPHSSSHHRNNNMSRLRTEPQPAFSYNSDRCSGHCGGGNFDECAQGALNSRKRRREMNFSEMWHPPIAPDPYYSPFVVDPHEVTQPLKVRKGNSPDSRHRCGGSMDACQDSQPTGNWISNVRQVVKDLDSDLSIFKRAEAVAQVINSVLKQAR